MGLAPDGRPVYVQQILENSPVSSQPAAGDAGRGIACPATANCWTRAPWEPDRFWRRPLAPVDYSARVQTVHADTNRRNDALLRRFNIRGEPIVCTPEGLVQDYRSTLIED